MFVNTYQIGKYDLNPRGNLWAKDENKFGQKLLTKLGWSQGKGLGKNENGITEGIKVRMKVGQSGVGFTAKIPIGVESHEYDAVLESLNNKFKGSAETKTENKSKGLEQRSQQFKKRLHYQKFIKGKDVCRYSEKDMNSIFVTRKTPVEPAAVPVKSSVTNVDSNPPENDAPESVPTFKSRMSMNDYFAMKLKKKSEVTNPSLLCNEETQDLDSSPEALPNKKRKRELKNGSKKSKKIKFESEDPESVETMPEIADTDIKKEELSKGEISPSNKKEKKNKKIKLDPEAPENVETMPEVCYPDIKKEELSEGEISPSNKKEKKNKKSKFAEKLENLKSCIKNNFVTNLWFKQEKKEVSFNDSVSYKIIENVLHKDSGDEFFMCDEADLINPMDCYEDDINTYKDECNIKAKVPYTIEELNNVNHLNNMECNVTNNGEDYCKEVKCEELEEGEIETLLVEESYETPKCFDLPKLDKSNYNTWLESQRIATKMKVYKSMVKKFRKNPVLKTSNLLDIKGYGNWGL